MSFLPPISKNQLYPYCWRVRYSHGAAALSTPTTSLRRQMQGGPATSRHHERRIAAWMSERHPRSTGLGADQRGARVSSGAHPAGEEDDDNWGCRRHDSSVISQYRPSMKGWRHRASIELGHLNKTPAPAVDSS